jgi:hypothetical protein
MTQDEITEIYLQVSKELCNNNEWCWAGVGEPLQMFAKLVAAKEREACAKVCDAFQARDVGMQPAECAGAIRARGQA